MTQINKDSFFYYFYQETGGLHDPRLVTIMIEKLKEWLPESTEDDDSWDYTPDYYIGQSDYKRFLMENLK
jgi:hypothetical protein